MADTVSKRRYFLYDTGVYLGTLTMEMGGTVKITSDRTSYSTELEFKLKVKRFLIY